MNEEEKQINADHVFNQGMLANSLKIMSGKQGGGFYVNYRFDKMNGFGFLQLMLEYPEGDVFAVPLCKNVGKPIETDEERNGVAKAKAIMPSDAPFGMRNNPPLIIPSISGMGRYMKKDLFVQYERPDFPIPFEVIWKRIAELWGKIPIENWCGSFSYAEVYQALLEVGENKSEQYQDDVCVLLKREEIESVAEEMGYDFLNIRNVFENRHLWKKDRNSLGYQFSKKINGKVERFYALKRISTLECKERINTEYAIEYTEQLPMRPTPPPKVPAIK